MSLPAWVTNSLSCMCSACARKPRSHSYKCQPFFVSLRGCVAACLCACVPACLRACLPTKKSWFPRLSTWDIQSKMKSIGSSRKFSIIWIISYRIVQKNKFSHETEVLYYQNYNFQKIVMCDDILENRTCQNWVGDRLRSWDKLTT